MLSNVNLTVLLYLYDSGSPKLKKKITARHHHHLQPGFMSSEAVSHGDILLISDR